MLILLFYFSVLVEVLQFHIQMRLYVGLGRRSIAVQYT